MAERQSNPWMRMAGVVAMALGLSLVACRVVFLPFALESPYGALATGVPAGLFVVGIQLLLRSRGTAQRGGAGGMLIAALGPSLAVFGAFSVVFAAQGWTAADVALVPRALPAFDIRLPAWDAEIDRSNGAAGRIVLTAPSGGGRFLELRWTESEPIPIAVLAEMLGAAANSRVTRTERAVEGGAGAEAVCVETPGSDKRAVLASWHCPEAGVAAYLMAFLDRDCDELLLLARRITSTLACTPLRATPGDRAAEFARFAPPEGYAPADAPAGRAWTGPADDAFLLFPAQEADAGFADFARRQGLVRKLLASTLPVTDLAVEPAPVAEAGEGGAVVYRATARDETGEPLRFVLALLSCPDAGTTHMALHVGPQDLPEGPVRAALLALACP